MRVEYHKCDHCGKELDEMHDYVDTEIDAVCWFSGVDLCKECAKELEKIVTSFLNRGVNND